MLKSIDPLLNADVLYALAAMGHGDELVVCDANFPADSVAQETSLGELLRIDGVSSPRALEAVLSLLPVDTFDGAAVFRMEVVDNPDELPAVQVEAQAVVDAAEGRKIEVASIERFAFYERAKRAYCVIASGERRFYGCFIVRKGVIPPEAA